MNQQKENKLKQLRESHGLSQKNLAEKSGVNLRSLQDYEQGHKNIASAKGITLYRLSQVLSCSMEELIIDAFIDTEVADMKSATDRISFYNKQLKLHMPKRFPIGVENFEDMITNHYYYVDKTLFIKDLLDYRSKVNLFTRPRRFGKTLNLSMLQHFFEDTGDDTKNQYHQSLFKNLNITSAGGYYLRHMTSYPVIHLTLKSVKQPTFESSFSMLKRQISDEFRRHSHTIICPDNCKERYHRLLKEDGTYEDYADALRFLSSLLADTYHQNVIILIDEYDVPLENAWIQGFYKQMVDIIRSLFESALKTNPHLEFAVITGCLRISKESIFTGLNHLNSVSILDKQYSEHFGFTEKEVFAAMKYYGQTRGMNQMKIWYNGYLFGNTEVYNPWSVMKFMYDLQSDPSAFPKTYWANTISNDIVRRLVKNAQTDTKMQTEQLMQGGSILLPVHEELTYEDIFREEDNIWNFLYFTGYLTKEQELFEQDRILIRAKIPNREVLSVYNNTILNWFHEDIRGKNFFDLYHAMKEHDLLSMTKILNEQLRSVISFHDSAENFYHGFLSGVFGQNKEYMVKSNRESGNGRSDLLIFSPDLEKEAFVIEIKAASKYQHLDKCCEEALKQIKTRRYMDALSDMGYEHITCYAISFYRKNCRIAHLCDAKGDQI